jgi:hypothetical protein
VPRSGQGPTHPLFKLYRKFLGREQSDLCQKQPAHLNRSDAVSTSNLTTYFHDGQPNKLSLVLFRLRYFVTVITVANCEIYPNAVFPSHYIPVLSVSLSHTHTHSVHTLSSCTSPFNPHDLKTKMETINLVAASNPRHGHCLTIT